MVRPADTSGPTVVPADGCANATLLLELGSDQPRVNVTLHVEMRDDELAGNVTGEVSPRVQEMRPGDHAESVATFCGRGREVEGTVAIVPETAPNVDRVAALLHVEVRRAS